MIRLVSTYAHQLDAWLKEHMGRVYTAILIAALISSIGATVRGITTAFGTQNWISIPLTIAVDVVLLVNQLAQLHEYREHARTRREARKAAKSPPES